MEKINAQARTQASAQTARTNDAQTLLERVQIVDLFSRYFAAVDDKRVDASVVGATFTVNGRVVAPNGMALVGRDAITAGHAKTFARFRATHHVISDHVIDLVEDSAHVRANMTAMHLWSEEESDPLSLQAHFVAGGVFEASAVRTEEGWRLAELRLRVTWRTGAGLPVLARTVHRE